MAEAERGTLEIRVMTPASWIDLDLDPATRAESIGRLLDERAAAGDIEVDPAQRAELAGLLERTAADAQAKGGIFASVFSDMLEGRPVSATLIVSLVAGEGVEPGEVVDRAGLAADLREVLADGAQCDVVQLPAGPAVRTRGRIEVPLGPAESRTFTVESIQYFVPLPGATHLVLLSFSTPILALADVFAELFDAIAGTLSWR